VTASAPAAGVRASVRLTGRCDNACCFCAQHGTAVGDRDDGRSQLDAARRDGADEVSFVGGEPLLVDTLIPAIVHARALGFVAIGVQTNGVALAERAVLDRLRDAGLTDVHLSIHGAQAAIHDYHVGRPGAFVAVTAALANLRTRGVRTVVTSVLTRSNARAMGELPTWLVAHAVAGWSVALPHAAGRAAAAFDRVMPRLALTLPFVLHALDRARKLGLPVGMTDAPACLLGPWIAESRIEQSRSFAPVCDGCDARPRCAGVDAAYLARFGGDELRPRARADAGALSMSAALRRCFVGVGERIELEIPRHEPAAAARRRLPLLERPAPGRDENRTRPQNAAPLFPALTDEEP